MSAGPDGGRGPGPAPRMVHLLDVPRAGEGGIAACRAVLAGGGPQDVWLIGTTADEARAWSMGVPAVDRIPEPIGAGLGAARALARLARARRAAWNGQPVVAVCWSERALRLALAALGAWAHVGVLVHALAPVSGFRALARRAVLRRPTIVTVSDVLAGALVADGAIDVRIAAPPVPGALPSRSAARARLNLAPDERVVGLAGARAGELDARAFAFIGGVFYLGERRAVMLAPRGSVDVRRALRFVRTHGRRWELRLYDEPTERVLPACDVAVRAPVAGADAGAVELAASLAAGVPIVGAWSAVGAGVLGAACAPYCLSHAPAPIMVTGLAIRLLDSEERRAACAAALLARAGSLPGEPLAGVVAGVCREACALDEPAGAPAAGPPDRVRLALG